MADLPGYRRDAAVILRVSAEASTGLYMGSSFVVPVFLQQFKDPESNFTCVPKCCYYDYDCYHKV